MPRTNAGLPQTDRTRRIDVRPTRTNAGSPQLVRTRRTAGKPLPARTRRSVGLSPLGRTRRTAGRLWLVRSATGRSTGVHGQYRTGHCWLLSEPLRRSRRQPRQAGTKADGRRRTATADSFGSRRTCGRAGFATPRTYGYAPRRPYAGRRSGTSISVSSGSSARRSAIASRIGLHNRAGTIISPRSRTCLGVRNGTAASREDRSHTRRGRGTGPSCGPAPGRTPLGDSMPTRRTRLTVGAGVLRRTTGTSPPWPGALRRRLPRPSSTLRKLPLVRCALPSTPPSVRRQPITVSWKLVARSPADGLQDPRTSGTRGVPMPWHRAISTLFAAISWRRTCSRTRTGLRQVRKARGTR
mmetsp:Transcript_23147/g.33180  ORF Transcript_23147/g.33180 Transcript_23147/m.33180 type:complete len:354 (+) Transcript_23147:1271-2332(+)